MRPCVLLLLLNLSEFIEVCAHYYVVYTCGAKLESMRFCVQLLHYNESGCIELSVQDYVTGTNGASTLDDFRRKWLCRGLRTVLRGI